MTRLDRKQRQEIYALLKPLWDTGYETTGAVADPGNIGAQEILMRKYRLAFCMKILQKYGLAKDIDKNTKLPVTEKIISKYSYEYTDEECYSDDPWETIDMISSMSNKYLDTTLKQTSWSIYRFYDLPDYEKIIENEKVFNRIERFIERHWGMMIATNNEYSEQFVEESEILTNLGLSPDQAEAAGFYFAPSQNLVLANKKIEKMLKICRAEDRYKQSNEYTEVLWLISRSVFERWINDVTIHGTPEMNWCCFMYPQGEYVTDGAYELIGEHQLNYEAVIFLLLADMAAEDFLERYEQEKGGEP